MVITQVRVSTGGGGAALLPLTQLVTRVGMAHLHVIVLNLVDVG